MDRIAREERRQRLYRQQKVAFARMLRGTMTPAEKKLWTHLRGRGFYGIKFRRQVAMGPYIADFLCFERSLIVEVDGGIHQMQMEYDYERDLIFKDYGYTVLRVSNEDVLNNDGKALQRIKEALAKNKTTNTPLSPRERGWG